MQVLAFLSCLGLTHVVLLVQETKKREALEKMVIELQILLFRMQRFGIFSFILLPGNFAGAFAPLFSISNVFYLICFELQLDINPRLLVSTETKNVYIIVRNILLYTRL